MPFPRRHFNRRQFIALLPVIPVAAHNLRVWSGPAIESGAPTQPYTPTHWTTKAFPGKPYVHMWGWNSNTTHQYDPLYLATPGYVKAHIIDKAIKWGLNYIDTYPTETNSGSPLNPFKPQDGDPIPLTWSVYSNPDWNEAAYRDLTKYLHDRGIVHEFLVWGSQEAADFNCWEYIFREMGNVLRDGLAYSIDGFEEEYYPSNDGAALTETISKYHPGAFTIAYPVGYKLWRPSVPPPLYAGAIMDCMGWIGDTRFLDGISDQPILGTSNGIFKMWLGTPWYQADSNHEYFVFQGDDRLLQPRPPIWKTGGGSYTDWIEKQAGDFARRNLSGKSCSGSSVLFWEDISNTTVPEYMRKAISGISADPIKVALASKLIATGKGGFHDLFHNGANSYPEPHDTAFIQNNYLRMYRSGASDGGSLKYDRDIAAHFDNHSNRESATNNVQLSADIYKTVLSNLSDPSFLPSSIGTIGVFDGSNAEFGAVPRRDIRFNMDTQSAREFPNSLTSDFNVTLSFRADPGYYRLSLRTVSGILRAIAFLDGESSDDSVLGGINGRNDLFFNILSPGTHTIKIRTYQDSNAAIDAIQITKVGNMSVLHSYEEEAGVIAVLKEQVRKPTINDTILSETRRYTAINDTCYITLETSRAFDTGSDIVDSCIGLPNYDTLIADGKLHDTTVTLSGNLPAVLRLIDSTGSCPELVILVQDLGNAHRLTWTRRRDARFTSRVGTTEEKQKFQFVVPQGMYDGSDYPRLKAALNTAIESHAFGIDDAIKVANPHPVPIVKVIRITDPDSYPYYVKEKDFSQPTYWWMFRYAQQGMNRSSDDYVKVYMEANGSNEVQRNGCSYIKGVVKPGWGCQNILAIRDDMTSTSVTVQVLDVTPVINAPRVEFKTSFDTVAVNGKDWRYFDGKIVSLPNAKGTYHIAISTTGVAKPHLVTTAMTVSECSWDDANQRLKVAIADPPGYGGQRPSKYTYKVIVNSEGQRIWSVDNGGRVAEASDYRIAAADLEKMNTRGKLIFVETGTTHIECRGSR